MIEIVEIIRRSEQGITQPYICRGSDDNVYFVKGVGASRRSLLCEWLAGNLAYHFNIPIAPFTILSVPEELIDSNPAMYDELGAGCAFGSLERKTTELSYSNLGDIPAGVQQDIIVFDWWVCNGDRQLSKLGGNPNLLWDPLAQELIVIDHNQAFDFEMDKASFYRSHIFSESTDSLTRDFMRRSEYNTRLQSALDKLPAIAGQIPPSWWYLDPESTIPVDFDLNQVEIMLARFRSDEFWDR